MVNGKHSDNQQLKKKETSTFTDIYAGILFIGLLVIPIAAATLLYLPEKLGKTIFDSVVGPAFCLFFGFAFFFGSLIAIVEGTEAITFFGMVYKDEQPALYYTLLVPFMLLGILGFYGFVSVILK